MRVLLDAVLQAFQDQYIKEVYPSFDAVPLPKKSPRLFTVVSLDSVQFDLPFSDGISGVHPFTACFKVYVLIPLTDPVSRAEEFFYQTVFSVMQSCGTVLCEVQPPHTDLKLQRLVMSGMFRMKGVYADVLESMENTDPTEEEIT